MSDHYIIELNIKSVTKPEPIKNSRGYADDRANASTASGERIVDDVARVVFKAENLIELVTKTKDHLDIIAEVEDHG